MAEIRKLASQEWQVLREARLMALKESPRSFGRTYVQEVDLPDAEWQERCQKWPGYIATNSGEIVGLAAGGEFDVGMPELHSMWVAPSHRGSGLADNLAARVIEQMQDAGATRVVLHTAEDNIQAICFYERLGFERTGAGIYMGSRPDVWAPELTMDLKPVDATAPAE